MTEEIEGVLSINLKGTEVKTEERKGWLARIFLGKEITVEQEPVTQMQYLEKIYKIFKSLGYENVLSMNVNGVEVYFDENNTEKDFELAMQSALSTESKEAYHVEISLDTTGDELENINVNMYGQHKLGEIPLVINVSLPKTSEEINTLLEDIKTKINVEFGIESGEIEVYDEEEDEDDEETDEEEGEEEDKEA